MSSGRSHTGGAGDRTTNGIVRQWRVAARTPGKHGLVVEFGARVTSTEGLHVGVDVGEPYDEVREWFGPPDDPRPLAATAAYYNSVVRREPPVYARRFLAPGVTPARSYYWYFEGPNEFHVEELQFLDYHGRQP